MMKKLFNKLMMHFRQFPMELDESGEYNSHYRWLRERGEHNDEAYKRRIWKENYAWYAKWWGWGSLSLLFCLLVGQCTSSMIDQSLEQQPNNPYKITLYSNGGEVIDEFCARSRPIVSEGAYRFRDCDTGEKVRITGTVVAEPFNR